MTYIENPMIRRKENSGHCHDVAKQGKEVKNMQFAVENPMVRWKENEPKILGEDSLGNEVMEGDEILVLDDEFFRKEDLSYDAIHILEMFGAEEKIAE